MKRIMITLIFLQTFLILTAPANERLFVPVAEPLSVELNWHNIRKEVARLDIREPDILFLQIRLETGNLTSRLCRECNNLTGMKKAVRRKTTAIGREKNGAAVYDSWQDSLKDYKLWQDYMYRGGDYLMFLSRVYTTDPYYLSKLKRL